MDRVAEEIGRGGWIAVHRCLQAMGECEDELTRLALWKAAKRYAERARCELTAGVPGEENTGRHAHQGL